MEQKIPVPSQIWPVSKIVHTEIDPEDHIKQPLGIGIISRVLNKLILELMLKRLSRYYKFLVNKTGSTCIYRM